MVVVVTGVLAAALCGLSGCGLAALLGLRAKVWLAGVGLGCVQFGLLVVCFDPAAWQVYT